MRRAALVGASLLAALALQLADARLAASQSTTLVARAAPAVSTEDPWDAIWSRLEGVELALSAQNVVAPRGGTRDRLRARALHDGARLFVLLEWADTRRDGAIDSLTAYPDAAALQFPAASATEVPPLCMGSPTAIVNIWHWKAAWQDDLVHDFTKISTTYPRAAVDQYPFGDDDTYAPARRLGNLGAARARTSPVENVHAGQYGTLTTAAAQPVGGVGVWRGGVWRVLFWRAFEPTASGDVRFGVGASVDAAAAVWDGQWSERDGMKAVSQFFAIRVAADPSPEQHGALTWLLVPLVPIALLIGSLVWMSLATRPRATA